MRSHRINFLQISNQALMKGGARIDFKTLKIIQYEMCIMKHHHVLWSRVLPCKHFNNSIIINLKVIVEPLHCCNSIHSFLNHCGL